MPTIVSHPAVLLALRPAFRFPRTAFVFGALCSIIPDFDVLGFRFGIQYGDLMGHRGFTHSLFFAVLLSAVITVCISAFSPNMKSIRTRVFIFLFLCTASHGILDAFTNGGLGVAFFSPFSNARYFFAWRPLAVSPIGVHRFWEGSVPSVLISELVFLWFPCALIFMVSRLYQQIKAK